MYDCCVSNPVSPSPSDSTPTDRGREIDNITKMLLKAIAIRLRGELDYLKKYNERADDPVTTSVIEENVSCLENIVKDMGSED